MAEFVRHHRHSYRFNVNKKNKQTFSKLSTLHVENTFCLHEITGFNCGQYIVFSNNYWHFFHEFCNYNFIFTQTDDLYPWHLATLRTFSYTQSCDINTYWLFEEQHLTLTTTKNRFGKRLIFSRFAHLSINLSYYLIDAFTFINWGVNFIHGWKCSFVLDEHMVMLIE